MISRGKQGLVCLALMAITMMGGGRHSAAQQFDTSKLPSGLSLVGIKKIEVYVSKPDADAEMDGLDADTIRTDVSLKLREAGIPIYVVPEDFKVDKKEFNEVGSPTLHISIDTFKDNGLYAFAVTVQLKQMCLLQRDPQRSLHATTWEETRLGTVGQSNVRQIRDSVKDLVDKFCNLYLTENPKK